MTEDHAAHDDHQQLPEGGKAMPLLEHLGELRGRLVKCAGIVILLFLVGISFANYLIDFLSQPLVSVLPENANVLHFTGPMDVFVASMKISIVASLVCSCPVWIWHMWRFVEPALYEHERKYIIPFIMASISLFLAGVAFSYLVILPYALEFLIGLGTKSATAIITQFVHPDGATKLWRI